MLPLKARGRGKRVSRKRQRAAPSFVTVTRYNLNPRSLNNPLTGHARVLWSRSYLATVTVTLEPRADAHGYMIEASQRECGDVLSSG